MHVNSYSVTRSDRFIIHSRQITFSLSERGEKKWPPVFNERLACAKGEESEKKKEADRDCRREMVPREDRQSIYRGFFFISFSEARVHMKSA